MKNPLGLLMNNNVKGDDALEYFLKVRLGPVADDAKMIKETLTRIGVASIKRKVPRLRQTVHLVQHNGELFLGHCKMMFIRDNGTNTLSAQDIVRLHVVAINLERWGLLELENPEFIDRSHPTQGLLTVIKKSEAPKWDLRQVYIENRKHPDGALLRDFSLQSAG